MTSDLDELIQQLTDAVRGIKDKKQQQAVVNAINRLKEYLAKTYRIPYPTSGWIPPF